MLTAPHPGTGRGLFVREKIEETQSRAKGPLKGLALVLLIVVVFLLVLTAATFLVSFIME